MEQRRVGRRLLAVQRIEGRAVDHVNVEPSVVVVIDQANARAVGLDDVFLLLACPSCGSNASVRPSPRCPQRSPCPLRTKPPAVIGRCCSSNWAGCGGPVSTPPADCGALADCGPLDPDIPGNCCEEGVPDPAVCAKREAETAALSRPAKVAVRRGSNMAESIRGGIEGSIDRKVESGGNRSKSRRKCGASPPRSGESALGPSGPENGLIHCRACTESRTARSGSLPFRPEARCAGSPRASSPRSCARPWFPQARPSPPG